MKDYLRGLIADTTEPNRQLNILREYLQTRILGSLQRSGAMVPMAFHGGTALRFLFNLPRSSEDLDFALEGARTEYNLQAYLAGIQKEMEAENYDMRFQHHDRASLLAGKLHAVLQRPFAKGRDLYDLIWYLSDRDWPAPNLTLLNNALKQTGWEGDVVYDVNWKIVLREHIRRLDWRHVQADVRPFLERPEDAQWVTPDNLLRLLK